MHMKAQFDNGGPRPPRYTRDQYMRMAELGIFDGMRVQLIDGEIFEMPAQGNKHFATIDRVRRLLEKAFGPGFWVRAQATIDLEPKGIPDPDITVVEGDPDNPSDDNPTSALLIVEISDSRLHFDRTRKASLYAASGIPDYWIVNVPDRQLEIRRDPQPDATQDFGYGYAALTTLKPGESATPLAAPKPVKVDKMFF